MTYDVFICFFSVTLTMNRLKCRCTKGLMGVEDALHPTLTLHCPLTYTSWKNTSLMYSDYVVHVL